MKEIPLRNRNRDVVGYAKVDDEDFGAISKYSWFMIKSCNCYYAQSSYYFEGKQFTIQMHRWLLNIKDKGICVDHINHDGLDNQRANLRIASSRQNRFNSLPVQNTSSKYKGVSLVTYRSKQKRKDGSIAHYEYKRWRAMINIDGKNIGLNSFTSEEEAAKVYDYYARKHHKEFARLNFPNENIEPKLTRRKSCSLAEI